MKCRDLALSLKAKAIEISSDDLEKVANYIMQCSTNAISVRKYIFHIFLNNFYQFISQGYQYAITGKRIDLRSRFSSFEYSLERR